MSAKNLHPHHQLALDKARSGFRLSRARMYADIKRERNLREYMLVRDMTGHYHRSVLRAAMNEVLRSIEDYQASAEILVCVERMLEKAS